MSFGHTFNSSLLTISMVQNYDCIPGEGGGGGEYNYSQAPKSLLRNTIGLGTQGGTLGGQGWKSPNQ